MTLGELRIRRKTAEVAKAPVAYGTFFRQQTMGVNCETILKK